MNSARAAITVIVTTAAMALPGTAWGQSDQPAIFVANNGNCEGSVTSFTVNADGTLNFVQKLVTEAVPCGSGQTAPGLNAQAIAISPSGRWLITGHGTINGVTEQLTFFEVHDDATMSIVLETTTPDSPVDVGWLDDEYVVVTATPPNNDSLIVYRFDASDDTPTLTPHYFATLGSSTFDFVIDHQHDLLFARSSSFAVQPFRINPNRTLTKLTPQPLATGIYFLGPGLSPDGTKLYYGGGISSFAGLSSRWIGGFNIDTVTGAMTTMPNSPYLSPPADGQSGPSPKQVVVSSDNRFAFVGHGRTAHIAGFTIDQETGELTPIAGSYFDVGSQGDSGNMSVMNDFLFVPRRYSSSTLGPSGVFSLTINKDGTLTPNGVVYPTTGSLPWDIAVWEGLQLCSADITGDGNVNVADLLEVVGAFGTSGGPADINGDSTVDVADVLAVVSNWGACP